MKATVLKCKLKKDKKDGAWILGSKRTPEKEFEIINPTPGDIANIEKICDIKTSSREIDDIVDAKTEELQPEDNSELIEFANDCWNLAVELRKKIEKLEADAVKVSDSTQKKKPATRKKKAK